MRRDAPPERRRAASRRYEKPLAPSLRYPRYQILCDGHPEKRAKAGGLVPSGGAPARGAAIISSGRAGARVILGSVALLDQPITDHARNRGVKRAGQDSLPAIGLLLERAHDGIPVHALVADGEQNGQHRLAQRDGATIRRAHAHDYIWTNYS